MTHRSAIQEDLEAVEDGVVRKRKTGGQLKCVLGSWVGSLARLLASPGGREESGSCWERGQRVGSWCSIP